MEETEVLSLIAQGENECVELKRALDLSTARGKAEFIKDLIALVNSCDIGYLIVGVDDDKVVVGIDHLEEERIQQIAHAYISPPVLLRCSLVATQVPGCLSIGVIAAKSTNKPHEVRRGIDNIVQDDVFVRRGTVVSKASSHEVKRMLDSETQLQRQSREYSQAAETHKRLGNWQMAVNAYSRAIEITPTDELFLARGKAYERWAEESSTWQEGQTLRSQADKDFADALMVATSGEIEQKARLGRVRIAHCPWEEWQHHVDWLKASVEGRSRGEVLYWEVARWEAISDESVAPKAISLLTEAIDLGYTEPGVYFLRAWASFGLCNYGLVLQDTDEAIRRSKSKDSHDFLELLELKAMALVKMDRFETAHKTLVEAKSLFGDEPAVLGTFRDYGFARNTLHRFALAYELDRRAVPDYLRPILAILAIYLNGVATPIARSMSEGGLEFITELDALEKQHPGIKRTIRSMIGEGAWSTLVQGLQEFTFTFSVKSD